MKLMQTKANQRIIILTLILIFNILGLLVYLLFVFNALISSYSSWQEYYFVIGLALPFVLSFVLTLFCVSLSLSSEKKPVFTILSGFNFGIYSIPAFYISMLSIITLFQQFQNGYYPDNLVIFSLLAINLIAMLICFGHLYLFVDSVEFSKIHSDL